MYTQAPGGEYLEHMATEVVVFTKKKQDLAPPKKWGVILLNDDKTSFQFVEEVLQDIFAMHHDEAKAIAKQIDTFGRYIVGPYTFEVAEEKSFKTMDRANKRNFPFTADPVEM